MSATEQTVASNPGSRTGPTEQQVSIKVKPLGLCRLGASWNNEPRCCFLI